MKVLNLVLLLLINCFVINCYGQKYQNAPYNLIDEGDGTKSNCKSSAKTEENSL